MGATRRGGARPAAEIGAVRKEWGGKIHVALVYPSRYAVGMSNLGFLLVHAQVNARTDALCERVFLSGPEGRRAAAVRSPGGRWVRSPGAAGTTLESGRPLSSFDVVAFSLSYENDLLHLPGILSAGGVAPFRGDRAASAVRSPLVVAGGFAASLNPEPSGVFADAVVVGDGERAVEALLERAGGDPSDGAFLRELSEIPGVYVPGGYAPEYGNSETGAAGSSGGTLRAIRPLPGFPPRVTRETLDLSSLPPPPPVVLADDTELGRMALVETSRGCPRMCGFCAASHACASFRAFPVERVRAAVDAAWPHRKKIGLIGAAVLDWEPFRPFAREILSRGGSVSPASVRADLVDGEIAQILACSGHRTVALAPECGNERLRARVGKRVPDEVFLSAAAELVRAGIVSFKLYFLLGVPGTARDEEVEGIARFVRLFRGHVLEEARLKGRMGTITAVLSPFVPKPFTPLQWAPMTPAGELRARVGGIAELLRGTPNLRWTGEPPRDAVLQGYLGLSDRRVEGELRRLPAGRRAGFPSWDERTVGQVVFREKGPDEAFPWDPIAGGIPKRALRARYEAYLRG